MKIRFFSISLLLTCLLATDSFAQKGKLTPIDYNDKLAAITDSLYNMGVAWGTEFQNINSSDKNFSKLAPHRKKIIAFTSRKIEEVRRGPTAGKGADNLKAAMLQFLTFEKQMIETAFAPLEKLTSASSETEVNEAIKKLTAESEKEAEELKRVNEAQEKFGEMNGFTLEAPQEED
jgi:hypothetical protein